MNCTRIALYDITSGSFGEVVEKAKAGMVPLFENSPGFLSYGIAEIGKNAFASVSTWKTRQQADDATGKAAAWVKTNMPDRFVLRENYIGDLAVDTAATKAAELAR
jgi:heme-degrading monooxygenase HmoA